jgi:hypothetical protein
MNSDSIRPLPPVAASQLSSPLGVVLTPDESRQRDQKRQGSRRRRGGQNPQEPFVVDAVEKPADEPADEPADKPATKSNDDSDQHIIDYYT